MKACIISFKECWQDEGGRWFSYGGFPLQMKAIGSLFQEVDLVITRGHSRAGGLPLPAEFAVTALENPPGRDMRRKMHILMHLPSYLRRLSAFVRPADVVHVPLPGDIPLLGMMVALWMRKPVIARYGGSWVHNDRTTFMNCITQGLMRHYAHGRNVMLATGEGDKPPADGMEWVFVTALTQDEIQHIHPDFERGLSPAPTLAYAGRMSPEKGVVHLIQAAAALNASGQRRVNVVLAGDGPQRPTLERLARELECGDTVLFTGQLDRVQLSNVMLRADLCVQPSLTEGFSKAWLDAMAHGLPVITSDVGAASGVMGYPGERGWLVPPGRTDRLVETLNRVLSSPIDWPALRRRCRSYVENRTLEAWARWIGNLCADRWDMALVNGKLVAKSSNALTA